MQGNHLEDEGRKVDKEFYLPGEKELGLDRQQFLKGLGEFVQMTSRSQ